MAFRAATIKAAIMNTYATRVQDGRRRQRRTKGGSQHDARAVARARRNVEGRQQNHAARAHVVSASQNDNSERARARKGRFRPLMRAKREDPIGSEDTTDAARHPRMEVRRTPRRSRRPVQ